MNSITESLKQNRQKFYFNALALILGIVAFVYYLSTGIIGGFTDVYSIPVIVLSIIGIVANVVFLVKRVDILEMVPFIAYCICIFQFLAVNANYIVAVIRAIDISSFGGSFIATIILYALAAISYLLGFAFKASYQ